MKRVKKSDESKPSLFPQIKIPPTRQPTQTQEASPRGRRQDPGLHPGQTRQPAGGLPQVDLSLQLRPRMPGHPPAEGLHRQNREGRAEDAHHGHRRRR